MSRPAQIRFLSGVAALYDPVVAALGFRGLWRRVADVASPAEGAHCLDVCTGTGGVAIALAARGANVIGLDLAPGMLARAEQKARRRGLESRVRFARMDARAIAFPEKSFDLVTCCMALHEMSDEERDAALSELARVARADVLVAEYRVPERGLAAFAFRLGHVFEYLESDDFRSFLQRGMEDRLAGAGLRIEERADAGAYRLWRCRAGR
ncbi:demethylmenaquinone methyltransferase / 2-methoxy-6-polyprenyl-1,4-benzoquinol methylase [Myxococcaceae bacterium]|nr:demethylmenaquinone methyltransferase / 2-methoxy-6-polyprenyl-1,4-benzoquinol methylase [Myxococcaceae bacterium]